MSDQTILARLDKGHVFAIIPNGDYFVIQGRFENYAGETLTRAELRQLAQEIKELADV